MMEKSAKISWCGQYRFSLKRVWETGVEGVCVIMLNPSTADAFEDDATIRALIRLLKAQGYGGMEIVNLFAWRSTDPRKLATAYACGSDVIGDQNDLYIIGAMSRYPMVVCAWGANKFVVQSKRGVEVAKLIETRTMWCFGKTKAGAPRHPLYLKTGTTLEIYDG